MRHIGSILLSLVFGAAAYVLVGIGLVKMGGLTALHHSTVPTAAVAAGALAGAGVLYAILLLSRLSPVGPVVVALAYLGVTAWPRVAGGSFDRWVPTSVLGVHGALRLPSVAVAALLAVPLLATVFSGRRWKRWPYAPAEPSSAFAVPGATPPAGDTESYPSPSLYGGLPAYSPNRSPFPSPISGGPVTYGSGTTAETEALPTSAPPAAEPARQTTPTGSAWPVREDPRDSEATRKLP
jgi:hypothetical protein